MPTPQKSSIEIEDAFECACTLLGKELNRKPSPLYNVHLLQVPGRVCVPRILWSQLTSDGRMCKNCQQKFTRSLSWTAPVSGIFEPDDLKLEPDVPEYAELNLRMRGYDFVTLEAYAKYVHGLADALGLDTDAYAVHARCFDVRTFKPRSTVIDNKYDIKIYERTVSLENVPSTRLPILLEMMRVQAPEGVFVTVKEPDAEEEENRYIPDKAMEDLRAQLKAIEDAREERRKK
ncbi:hypothetical protein BaRGS_00001850 [Batillaria attramentaria]|uniref:Small ribosomal subunit protein uS10 domain-containing protein n=1 Tax=Batillaria attramentaria TaxID=370345 RepID=A0ABD0M5I1_9CAEN